MDRLTVPVPMQLPSQGKTGPLESLLTRIGKSSVAHVVGRRARLDGRLQLAGEPASVEAVLGAKVTAAIGVAALVAMLSMAAGLSVPLLALSVPIVIAATRAPDFVLARRARTRQRRIAGQVPDLAELLVATTGAGLNPPLAFRRSAEVLEGSLGDELRVAVCGLDLGAEWRVVLGELADRTGDPSMRRLVRAMGRSQRLGTPLASVLQSVAEDLRYERQARAEEAARRAPVKMLFPLVFLILPAFLLLTVGPVLLATLRSLR
jgi:tight adherence protein C